MKTLYDLFIHELTDLYCAAECMEGVLNRMSSLATNSQLVQMLDTYYSQALYQKKIFQEFFSKNSIQIGHPHSAIMRKIKDHCLASMRYKGSKEIRDIVLLLSVNIMKHFEITAFGTILNHANRIGREELVDMLFSVKRKIAEDEQKPLKIVSDLIGKAKISGIKGEVEELLGTLAKAQNEDELQLLTFLEELTPTVYSPKLQEALETYYSQHQNRQNAHTAFLTDYQHSVKIQEWSILEGFSLEWKEDLSIIDSQELRDIGVILSIQRIQHQNMATLEFEELLSRYLENDKAQKHFEALLKQEIGDDQSFTAIAEGSLLEEGLDTKVKP